MNDYQKEASIKLRSMTSKEAANWIITNHSDDGCFFVSKRSWLVEDQLILAKHFLRNIPHATGRCYENLLSVMSVKNFMKVVEMYPCDIKEENDLLSYYIFPALSNAEKSDKDKKIIERFKQGLS